MGNDKMNAFFCFFLLDFLFPYVYLGIGEPAGASTVE